MGWIVTIIVGFIVGVLAKLLHPGKDDLGFIMTTLLGIGGALLAGWVGQASRWYEAGQPGGWIASTIFAVIILAIYTRVIKKYLPKVSVKKQAYACFVIIDSAIKY